MAEERIEVLGWGLLPCCRFGSTAAIEERLAALVIAGRKRATVWDGGEENPTAPGMRWAVMAGARPVAVIETVGVGRRRFAEIDDIVPSYVFLASDEARQSQGQCLSPNGGDVFL